MGEGNFTPLYGANFISFIIKNIHCIIKCYGGYDKHFYRSIEQVLKFKSVTLMCAPRLMSNIPPVPYPNIPSVHATFLMGMRHVKIVYFKASKVVA